ncbi:uncharacterized protein LOC122499299 [Leptopilina heterotoma]|uniref:uncharacterized protein LOC122499299 n=1 Tax=Leptopilina heterotoma TaxID=63436 RepID=UPI001CA954CD|nr:uncharacterized protein LOC122499299 [Leptopilina heterotoma]
MTLQFGKIPQKCIQNTRNLVSCLKSLKVDFVGEGIYRARIKVEEKHLNDKSYFNYGLIAYLLDHSGTAVLKSIIQEPGLPIKLDIEYLEPVPLGRELILFARLRSIHNRYAHITSELNVIEKNKNFPVALAQYTKLLHSESKRYPEWCLGD